MFIHIHKPILHFYLSIGFTVLYMQYQAPRDGGLRAWRTHAQAKLQGYPQGKCRLSSSSSLFEKKARTIALPPHVISPSLMEDGWARKLDGVFEGGWTNRCDRGGNHERVP